MSDVLLSLIASDVYDERDDENLRLFVRADGHDSLIVDDAPEIEGGSFNVILENRQGVPYLVVWAEKDFGNDPTFTIRLDEGTLERRGAQ